ncbi:MAG TPA: rod shape-determining protein RodA [Verrucomicrobiae bacterium]|nr:rod shape-determining protein RodA [Verrucomicrobiae bacterium]
MRYLSIRDIDWTLLIIVLLICGVGVVQIYSATIGTDAHSSWWRQILWILSGLFLMFLVVTVDYHTWLHHVPIMYIISVVALLATAVLGDAVFGASRWIPLPGGQRLQVSEFVKPVIILLVARYLTELKSDELEIRETLILLVLVLIPTGLVLKQPDLGTALTYLAVLTAGAFLAGLNWKYIAAVALVALVVMPLTWVFVLQDYQKQRWVSYLNPDLDPKGKGYQLIQSQIAVGSGGMLGRGLTKGTQAKLRFLPVPYKDFVFAAFAEEQGFVGVVFMLSMYFVLIMRIVQNAQTASERSGMYICMGVAALLLSHILVNIGMQVGLMPVTGIPLPFMSAGGSSIWSNFIALGLVSNVRLRRFVN